MLASHEVICRELVQAALDLHERRLWESLASNDCFAIRVPGEATTLFGSIMGQGGEEYGLALYRGELALDNLAQVFDLDGFDEDFFERVSQIGVTIQPFSEIPPPFLGPLETAGFQGKGDTLAPMFLVKEAHRQAREIRPSEAGILLLALAGILKADEEGGFDPNTDWLDGGEMLTLEIAHDEETTELTIDWQSHGLPSRLAVTPPVALPESLGALPRREGCWVVGLLTTPFAIEGDARTLRILLAVDRESELILQATPVMGSDVDGAATAIVDILEGRNVPGWAGLPTELLFASRSLFEAMGPGLSALGIDVRYEGRSPLLEGIFEDFLLAAGRSFDEGDDDLDEPGEAPGIPETKKQTKKTKKTKKKTTGKTGTKPATKSKKKKAK